MSLNINKAVLLLSLSISIAFPSYAQYKFKWDNNFTIESEDKNFKFSFGGRMHYDIANIHQSDSLEARFGELTHGAEFRRLRFYTQATIYKNVSYKIQLDFAGGKVSFKDVYLEFLKIPIVGSIRVGQFKEPIRLEGLTSSNDLVLMERANFESFSEDRNSGVMIRNSYKDNKFAWQLGTFRNSTEAGDNPASNDEINITGRITSLALNNKDKKEFIHLGVASSFRNPKFNNYIIRVRPDAHLTPKYLTTNIIDNVTKAWITNLEVAYSRGPLTLQSEYSAVNIDAATNYIIKAYYAEISYAITGEQRQYIGSYEGLKRLTPKKNVGQDGGGMGAWEIALRYSKMDLDDKDLDGGTMDDITVGLNWYFNPAVLIRFNYVYSYMNKDDIAYIFQTRFQLVF